MQNFLKSIDELGPLLSQSVSEEENNRRLSEPVIQAIKAAGLNKLFMPKSLGGFEADPLTTAKLVEAVAHHNTAAGWFMMVSNVSTWWCNRLPQKGIEAIYSNGLEPVIAGAFHPPMMATPVKGGFRINGRSPLTSNVHEASWVFVSALIMDKGQPKMNNGIPEVIGVFMNASDCQILDTWHTLGMKASDSNDVAANEVFVPDHLYYRLEPELHTSKYYDGALYRFPAVGASVSCLIAPVALAVARNAITELKELANKKTSFGSFVPLRERGAIQRKLGIAEALVQSSRAYLYQTINEFWNKIVQGEILTMENKAALLLAATHTNQSCLQAVDLMYSASGTTGIYTKNKLAHYFSDAQVIRQHGFANESRYETTAQVYFGLMPDLPVLAF
jgi:indole-3-acetate monooxygenase